MPFRSVNGVYWFLYVLLGLYLFAPLVSEAVKKVSHTRYWLVLWGASLVMPYVNAWVPDAWPIKGDYYCVLSEFGGYMGDMVLGYYLRNNPVTLRRLLRNWLGPSVFLIIFIPVYFINGRCEAIENSMLYGYLTINVALMCILYFSLIQLLPPNCFGACGFKEPCFTNVRNLPYPYFCHAGWYLASLDVPVSTCLIRRSNPMRCRFDFWRLRGSD